MGSHGGYTLTKYFSDGKNTNVFLGWEVLVQPGWWPCRSGENCGSGKLLNKIMVGWHSLEKLTYPLEKSWKLLKNSSVPWKLMVGRWNFLLKSSLLSGHSLIFGGICRLQCTHSTLWYPLVPCDPHQHGEDPRESLLQNPNLKKFH